MRIKRERQASEVLVDILLLLFEEARSSSQLAMAMEELRGREVPLATFYRHLQKGIDVGWIDSVAGATGDSRRGGPGRPERGPGRPERVYRITAVGDRVLREGMALQRQRFARAEALGLLTEARS